MTCQFLMIFYGPKEVPRVKELGQKSPGRPPISWTARRLPWCETYAKNSYKYRNL